jgi:oligo-alginate lyase
MNIKSCQLFLIVLSAFWSCQNPEIATNSTNKNLHPNLILTTEAVTTIKKNLGSIPIFDQTLEETKKQVDIEISLGIKVPMPKDMAGGYTHTQHKKNYATMQKAGVLFQLLGDEKYAVFIKEMLYKYAKLYPTFDRHPQIRSYARGKFFWQCLNDSNWLVYTSQAYDCIYSWLSEEERIYLNTNLFRPYADFLSIETPQYFNRVHNHSTWGNVAVGMIGLVIDDEELIQRALYGLKTDDIKEDAMDNDGGFIKTKGQKTGFFANLEHPFSPDGYYTEGPYYQRYSMYPFLIFAQALETKRPELKIFEYKNGLLIKAVDALMNLTDEDGEFFPLNDGQKGMSYYTESLISAVDIAYHYGGKQPHLLSIAKKQNYVELDATGLSVALGLKNGEEKPFVKESLELTDGSLGDEGGIGILRHNIKNEKLAVVMKYTAHGLSHGHFDKLSFSMYHNGDEVILDYGLARFVNIEQKNGGGYLKENTTWAKQTIAHNTITQNETSHYEGDFATGSKFHSEKYFFDASNPLIHITSAKEKNAYPGTDIHRTMAIISENNSNPFVIDIIKIDSKEKNQYDLPYYYFGQIISTNFEVFKPNELKPLGTKNGYQHLWNEGYGMPTSDGMQFTWLSNKNFYTITSATESKDEILFAKIGANDPAFNLRNDPTIILRKKNIKNTVFASIIEPHGTYNPVTETAKDAYSFYKSIKVESSNEKYTLVSIISKEGDHKLLIIANNDNSNKTKHNLIIDTKTISWIGPYYFK